jgi:hypothetical protein
MKGLFPINISLVSDLNFSLCCWFLIGSSVILIFGQF